MTRAHTERLAIEREARAAGEWSIAAAQRAYDLRRLPTLTESQRRELAVLRQRETNESIRRLRDMDKDVRTH